MESGRMDPAGRDTTNAGRILGIIGVAMNVIGLLAGLVAAVFMFGLTMAGINSLF
jgi:hypothetical protein